MGASIKKKKESDAPAASSILPVVVVRCPWARLRVVAQRLPAVGDFLSKQRLLYIIRPAGGVGLWGDLCNYFFYLHVTGPVWFERMLR